MTTKKFLPKGAKARIGKGAPLSVAYSLDGTQFAVASTMGIWLCDAHGGGAFNLLTGHIGRIFSAAYSPDGGILAIGNLTPTKMSVYV